MRGTTSIGNKCSGTFWGTLEDLFKYNGVIRAYMETFLEIEMAAFINVLYVRYLYLSW